MAKVKTEGGQPSAKWVLAKIGDIKRNPKNPRTIKDHKFNQLVQSIKDFPEMLRLRPIVVNAQMMVLGGNMRLSACIEAGLKEVPVIIADELTEAQQQEFIIKDNVSFGEWDWAAIGEGWGVKVVGEWGLDSGDWGLQSGKGKEENQSGNPYTNKIVIPIYEPTGPKPPISDCIDLSKTNQLIAKIEAADIPRDEKDFLIEAAKRHTVFTYQNIAEYYAHSSKDVQELMEDSALVIIDFDKAIENGFVKLSTDIASLYGQEYPENDE